jgi:hypothetical protein
MVFLWVLVMWNIPLVSWVCKHISIFFISCLGGFILLILCGKNVPRISLYDLYSFILVIFWDLWNAPPFCQAMHGRACWFLKLVVYVLELILQSSVWLSEAGILFFQSCIASFMYQFGTDGSILFFHWCCSWFCRLTKRLLVRSSVWDLTKTYWWNQFIIDCKMR